MHLQTHIGNILTPPPTLPATEQEQRVEQRVSADQQRVIDNTPIITLQWISNAPVIMVLRNPMAKRSLKVTPHVHQCHTLNNTPGGGSR
jgi:hypothetical protein